MKYIFIAILVLSFNLAAAFGPGVEDGPECFTLEDCIYEYDGEYTEDELECVGASSGAEKDYPFTPWEEPGYCVIRR